MTKNLQDNFLSQLQQEHTPVTVFTINGFQLKGTITSFDQFTLLVERDGRQSLVYKSAVSTVAKEG
ncbi:RNA chaperone Hfq [Lawsonibacter sp. JLR.KK007]|jgi:host factor-I protein|uniref:RNA chaperone Hfq n=1 Tax=Lawsonibacter sp. JLR.KK007 TaxID=3114293 RepID=UPI002FF13C24